VELLGPIAAVENPPRMEGRFLSMIMAPNREAIEREKKAERKAAQEEAARRRAEAAAPSRAASRESRRHAQDEIAPRRREALQEDRHGQARAPQGEQAAHPHQEVVEAEAQAAPVGAGVVGRGQAPQADAADT
jgi:hypothetical protein